MKNLSLGLNIVLLIAVAVLYVLHFSGNMENSETIARENVDLDIAYINSDSLLKKYEYVTELTGKLEGTRAKLEKEYENRAKGLQSEVDTYRRTMGNMTISQAKAIEEDLMRKQQNLMQYQDQLTQQLMQEEAKVQEQIYQDLAGYLNNYGKTNNLQLVLTYQKGSGVLFANDSLNITDQVVAGLNDLYKNKDAKATPATAQSPADTTTKK